MTPNRPSDETNKNIERSERENLVKIDQVLTLHPVPDGLHRGKTEHFFAIKQVIRLRRNRSRDPRTVPRGAALALHTGILALTFMGSDVKPVRVPRSRTERVARSLYRKTPNR